MNTQEAVDYIRAEYREFRYADKQLVRSANALGAYVRLQLGWSPELEVAEQDAAKKRAAAAVQRIRKEWKVAAKRGLEGLGAREWVAEQLPGDPFVDVACGTFEAEAAFDLVRRSKSDHMSGLAERLPVWEAFGRGVRGFSSRGLAIVVGEAGNLSDYASDAKLWKRFGIAPYMDKACSTWRREGGLTAEQWTEAGYSPQRLSALRGWVTEGMWRTGTYAPLFKRRKAIEDARCESKMQAMRRALRYVEVKFLRHLWKAWIQCELVDRTPRVEKTTDSLSTD